MPHLPFPPGQGQGVRSVNEMPNKRIVTGQAVTQDLTLRARELRSAMTPAEGKLWNYLRGNRLGKSHFRRQQIINRFIDDFYCHQADLVIELDGPVHQAQVEYDAAREKYLQESGLKVLRFTNHEIEQEIEKVLEVILRTCLEGMNLPPAPP